MRGVDTSRGSGPFSFGGASRRLAYLVLAIAVTLALTILVPGARTPAQAASSLPDPAKDGDASLTVHKYVASDGLGEVGTGLPLSPTDEPSEPLAGAGFALYRVDVVGGGTSTNAGWQAIADLMSEVGSNPTLGQLQSSPFVGGVTSVATEITGDDGSAYFGALDFGLYYVVEETAPEGYFPVAPFLVTVPLTDPDNLDSWVYDIHVYPKDRPGPSKEVLDGQAGAPGEPVTWRISSPVPAGVVSGLKVRDTLAPQLRYVDVSQVAVMDYSTSQPETVKVFQEGVDYRVDTTGTGGVGGGTVEVVFLSEGLAYLEGVNSVSLRVVVDLDTICLEGGMWENTAEVCDTQEEVGDLGRRNRADDSGEVCLLTNTVNTKWGTLRLHKVDSSNRGKSLAGAEFELYYSHTNDFSSATATGQTITTDDEGIATITPLRFSDWAEGEALDPTDANYWYYWLVETKAPDGYVLPLGVIPLTITTAEADGSGVFNVEITNVAKPGAPGQPNVPGGSLAVTGATVGGLLLLIVGGLIVGSILKRRKNDNADA